MIWKSLNQKAIIKQANDGFHSVFTQINSIVKYIVKCPSSNLEVSACKRPSVISKNVFKVTHNIQIKSMRCTDLNLKMNPHLSNSTINYTQYVHSIREFSQCLKLLKIFHNISFNSKQIVSYISINTPPCLKMRINSVRQFSSLLKLRMFVKMFS